MKHSSLRHTTVTLPLQFGKTHAEKAMAKKTRTKIQFLIFTNEGIYV